MDAFKALLSLAAGNAASLPAMTRDEWDELRRTASKQSMLGVTFSAVDALPDGMRPPLGVYARWALDAERIRSANRRRAECALELDRMFAGAGLQSCILKGQGVARFYPEPELRQCGDIDIWVDGPRKDILAFLRGRCEVGGVVYHHCDARLFKDVSVEVHFTPTWMNDPLLNARLQRWFRACGQEQFSNRLEGYCAPTAAFDAVYLAVHIFRHLLDEGVGLRQLMDLQYVLRALTPAGTAVVGRTLGSLGLGRFTSAVMWVLGEAFGLPESAMVCPPDARSGAFLLDEVMRAGNFGKHDPRNSHSSGESRLGALVRKTRRQLRFFTLAPREVAAAPFFKAWQYCWRWVNNYL